MTMTQECKEYLMNIQGNLCQVFEILMNPSEHPDRERKLEVGISDSHSLIEHSLYSFLRP